MLKIIENTKWWFTFSSCIFVIGIGFLIYHGGINLGIDFKGGTLIEINMTKSFDKVAAEEIIKKYIPPTKFETSKANNDIELSIKAESESVKEEDISLLMKDMQDKFGKEVTLISSDTIGPSIGNELRSKAVSSLTIAVIAMLIYVGIRFEFKFGAAAMVSLLHDVLVTLCVYIIFDIPINLSFIAAMLTIIGYSINDTIVIFDRIRENLNILRKVPISEVVNRSITQTMTRSIYTVLTTLITISAVYIFVPIQSVREFALPLIVGIAVGCYSSIFIASPFWVIFKNLAKKRSLRA